MIASCHWLVQVPRSEVMGVERIHNHSLWTKFQARRAEVVAAAGFAQERFLFHGSAPGRIHSHHESRQRLVAPLPLA